MKAIYLSLAALAAFGIASCSSDLEPQTGETEDLVTVDVNLPATFESRAFGDGSVVKKLSYAVYDGDDIVYASDKEGSPAAAATGDNNFTLKLRLVNGRSYDFIFWADAAEGSPYTFDPAEGTVSIKENSMTLNDDTRDAFFQHVTHTADGKSKVEAQLRRPFAQLNVAAGDYEKYKALNNGETTSEETISISIANTYTTLNLKTGVASNKSERAITASAKWANDETITIDNKDYAVLSMNYILTGSGSGTEDAAANEQEEQKELLDVDIAINNENGEQLNSLKLTNVPFRRNYRTNIYGNIITTTADVKVKCVPNLNTPDLNKDPNAPVEP